MNQSLRRLYLDAMGIQSWLLKSTLDEPLIELEIESEEPQLKTLAPKTLAPENEPEKMLSKNIVPDIVAEKIIYTHDSDLVQMIRECKKCPSRQHRLNALIGQGSDDAPVFVITGAPTAEEDRAGHYCSGLSESLLFAMLCSVRLENSFYLSGLLKCYSMTDFVLNEQDVAQCIPYLYAQIEQVKPSILFVLGAFEAQNLLKTKQSFNDLRGKVHNVRINNKEYAVIVSYHPAYLLRNPLYKKESLKDLILLKAFLE